ncbi:hypothetical protein MNBD_GAMMA10-335 [hydrothermal vent metagenome]|uniref:HMA domain-containing protein n=1 Tax=hydrothermal vent metagenome TaxID=652676 RepID=A0A3B0XUM9_9ZZZZ
MRVPSLQGCIYGDFSIVGILSFLSISIITVTLFNFRPLVISKYKVGGASCGACILKIQKIIKLLKGVEDAKFDLKTSTLTVFPGSIGRV